MQDKTRSNQLRKGGIITILPMSASTRARKMESIVARRAFQISERRGLMPGREAEDWRQAESEIVSPLCGGLTVASDRISVTTTIACFKEGVIEIWIEPRRLTIFGTKRTSVKHDVMEKDRSTAQEHEIVRILDLPVEIDPSRVTARLSHGMAEISLPRAQSTSSTIHRESRVA